MRDVPVSVVLEAVEAAAANGKRPAERLLLMLLHEETVTGGLCMVSRLAAKRYLLDDRDKARP